MKGGRLISFCLSTKLIQVNNGREIGDLLKYLSQSWHEGIDDKLKYMVYLKYLSKIPSNILA